MYGAGPHAPSWLWLETFPLVALLTRWTKGAGSCRIVGGPHIFFDKTNQRRTSGGIVTKVRENAKYFRVLEMGCPRLALDTGLVHECMCVARAGVCEGSPQQAKAFAYSPSCSRGTCTWGAAAPSGCLKRYLMTPAVACLVLVPCGLVDNRCIIFAPVGQLNRTTIVCGACVKWMA